MSETATLVVTATPNPDEMASVQDYLKSVMPLLLEAGGTPVKRLKVSDVINGHASAMVLVMDFPSADAARDLFSSPAYGDLVATRDKGFREMNILITGPM
ncbi:DUF1330 domain-containing protein [Roseibium sediminis]|uniref:DUF1330 domain-containing protein n=1 Tax=Roseibium sediminis TaxID=1775174 RepID=UPI00123DD2E9|nr:DUF1330 domain-containing protein [Roseibium sediminis]